ncbi:MAG: ABC transporter permease subunit [Sedimentisphaerales bacterium]|nr:ABC transporter permease subunit [Sedimentisphaerales bacterium]
MSSVVSDSCMRVLRLSWLTGPVFDKELRVASRRRRNYLLRGVYVMGFLALVALVWVGVVPKDNSGAFQASRMAQAGQIIILAMVWFQFLGAQILAVVMLSTAISDEIYHRTLGLLMTTPIGSFQIVLGKLLSKLLQVVLLLAISLPMLAIVRVFGGVPWDFLLYALSMTLTTTVFYGCLSLFFSIFTRRAYVVIIQTILTGAVLFGLLPLLTLLLLHQIAPQSSERLILGLLFYLNPYFAMRASFNWFAIGLPTGVGAWPIHCGVALGASVLLLVLATVFVRKAALRQVTGRDGMLSGRRRVVTAEGASAGRIRRVIGPPILWKEHRAPLLCKWTVGRVIVALVGTILLLALYVLCAREHALDDREAHVTFAVIYTLLGTLVTAIVPATTITTEKESQAWPILLTTTVSNGAILSGKLFGAIRRCLPVWGLLLGHVIVFSLVGFIHPLAVLQFAILVGWVTVFLCMTGLYFSLRCKHTTAAVIANLALAAGIWAVLPGLIGLATVAVNGDGDLIELYMDLNPVVHAIVIALATAGSGGLAAYDWLQGGLRTVGAATVWMMFNFIAYVGIGLAFLARAWSRVRFKPV